MSIRQTAKKLGIARKTVSKYYKMDANSYVQQRTSLGTKIKKFDPYKDRIIEIYQRNDNKVFKSSVFDVLEEEFGQLPGSERTLRNYIQYLSDTGQLEETPPIRIYTPVEDLPYGQQMQLDFGETTITSGEKVYIFATVLSASRFRYVAVQKKPFKAIDIIQHLLDCFEYIGGIPREIVIDQDRAMVVAENAGDIILTKEFKDFHEEMGFSLYVCRKADPESKGKVENLVKFVKTSFFSGRRFNSFDEIPEKLDSWLVRRANGKICQATGLVPANFLEKEQECLKPLRSSIYKRNLILEREDRKVSEKCLISVGGSYYSVPIGYKKRKVWIYISDNELVIYESQDGEEIARHKMSFLPGQTIIQRSHLRNTTVSPSDLKEKLKERSDSDLWHSYVDANYKRFTRYFRDQHELLSQFLNTGYDHDIFKKALQFCLDSNKLSAADLREAYTYIQGIEQDQQPDILPTLLSGIRSVRSQSHDLKVVKRKLGYYTSLISILGGVL